MESVSQSRPCQKQITTSPSPDIAILACAPRQSPSVQNCSPRWLANTNRNDRSRRLEGNMELTFNRGVSHWSAVPSSWSRARLRSAQWTFFT